MENQNPRVSPLWEHSPFFNKLGHDPTSEFALPEAMGTLPRCIHIFGDILDLLSWDQVELKAVPAQQVYSLDDHGQGSIP